MPLILLARVLVSLLSWIIIGAAAYLLWSWNQGDRVIDVYGVVHIVRHDWRLWTGIALLAWSFGGGGLFLKPLLAKRDRIPLRFKRGAGRHIPGSMGVNLYIEDVGPTDAPCLVLTHGWGLDSTIWAQAKRDLSERFRIVTWDLPTMGASKAPGSAVSLETFAENLAIVVRHAQASSVVLIGHSIGGMTIQTLARDHKDFVRNHVAGIVLLNTTYHNPLKTMALKGLAQALRFPVIEPQLFATIALWPLAWLSAWKSYLDGSAHLANRLGFGPDVTHSQLEHTTLLSVRNPQGPQARGNLAMFRWEADGALTDTGVPVLVVGGLDDLVTQAQASAHIASTVPGAETLFVDRANHMGFSEHAEVYNAAIAAFAEKAFEQRHPRANAEAGLG